MTVTTTEPYLHPMRRKSDRAPRARTGMRALGLVWFFAMALAVALAGPLFLTTFVLGVVGAFGLRWMA